MKIKTYKTTFKCYCPNKEIVYITYFIDRHYKNVAIENARHIIAQALLVPYFSLELIDVCEV